MRPDQLQLIYGKTFRNQEVVLDGNKYDHCTFDNVTFVYDGIKPTSINACTFITSGKYFLRSHNDAVNGFEQIQYFLTHLPGISVTLRGQVDQYGNINPLIPGAPLTSPVPSPPEQQKEK